MAVGFPAKTDFATGEVLTATNMNDITGTLNLLNPSNTDTTNACINGGMDIWQRGTTFTIASGTPQYTADRWTNYFNGTGTIAQETTVKPDTSTYSLKITNTASSSDNAIFQLVEQQQMEQFRGRTVTLSVKLAGTATLAPGIRLAYSTTANDTLLNTNTSITASNVVSPTINLSTFVTYTASFVVPTTAKTLRIGIGTNTGANTNVLYVSEVQLELGSVATTFNKSGGSIGGELALCQRYYYRLTPGASGRRFGVGMSTSTTASASLTQFPVTMRTNPTALEQSGTAGDYSFAQGSVVLTCTSVPTFGTASTDSSHVALSFALGGLDGYAGMGRATNSTAFLAWSAEL
jgi:hypothetical protein